MTIAARCALFALLCAPAFPQAEPTLEAVSVKPSSDAVSSSNVDSRNARLNATGITVRELLRLGFTLKDFQIANAPRWTETDRFDITAKGTGGEGQGLDYVKSLVRQILADRFQLAVHREPRESSVYFLTVGKGGPKLTVHDDAGPRMRGGCGVVSGRRVTADTIAMMLGKHLDREVINRTGLTGEYDVQLEFTPDSGPCNAAPDAGGSPAGLSAPPPLITAVQQLGLKLTAGKGPVEFLVIDRLVKPSEN
jgi:uncharacterized protein (TIGR03435 family)